MKEFFSRNPEKLVNEIKAELYVRLTRTRELFAAFDHPAAELSLQDLGYRQGIREELNYLEKLMDTIERS